MKEKILDFITVIFVLYCLAIFVRESVSEVNFYDCNNMDGNSALDCIGKALTFRSYR